MTIKEKIQRILKEKGISAMKMENDLGFAKGYISKLDKASPSSDYIVKIADYLNVTTDSILKDSEFFIHMDSNVKSDVRIVKYSKEIKNMYSEDEELVKYFNQLPQSLRENFLNLVKATAKDYTDTP